MFRKENVAMNKDDEIKKVVREKYSEVARDKTKVVQSCCGPSASPCCGGTKQQELINMSVKYNDADKASVPDGADLGLGCGTPVAFADVHEGMTVLDLGAGAGIDCFVASKYVGKTGRVIGVDMTEEMIRKANENKEKVCITNVEFRLGEIESLPVVDQSIDRVISNCVINLVPDKGKAFQEIYRVLKYGCKFTVSDIVLDGELSEEERRDASLWAGCVSGALQREEYMNKIKGAGFKEIRILSEKKYDYKLSSGAGLFSVTISGTK
jgi:arsenite methyltransferase